MDYASCHIVYVDKRAYKDRYEERTGFRHPSPSTHLSGPAADFDLEARDVQSNLRHILHIFNGVHVCTSGFSCMAKLRELNEPVETNFTPIIVILDIFPDSSIDSRPFERPSLDRSTPSPTTQLSNPHRQGSSMSLDLEDIYGLNLLQHIANEVSYSNLSKLVIPIAMTQNPEGFLVTEHGDVSGSPSRMGLNTFAQSRGTAKPVGRTALDSSAPVEPKRMMKCLEAGAIDVLTSPLHHDRIYALTAHAYRAHKEAAKDQAAFLATKRLRKRSWVGIDEEQPYGYLRESMVSTLMTSICRPESVVATQDQRDSYVLDHRREVEIANAISQWNFSAHDFSEDELVHASFLMLRHALDMPELEAWRLSTDELKSFLMACRAAYNGFVLYHNFRHVVDVLQAVFYFLLQLGTLPPYPASSVSAPVNQVCPLTPMEALLKPFDALTLLISAIGHDVGHPGVNNAFLVALKAPLAQLYNDNSVLEAFHCAAYSQILRRFWTHAFEDSDMRNLLIKSILATDMGVHFKYMTDLGSLQEKLHHDRGIDGWNDKVLDEYRALVCGILIKCADISNVARPFKVAAKWSDILQLEFARQGEMEKDVGIPTTLFGGPPELGNVIKLANSQIGFMTIFAGPLFEAVADILPGMRFTINEIKTNQEVWRSKIEEEKRKEDLSAKKSQRIPEDLQSPRSGSPNRLPSAEAALSHPEGLPASGSSPSLPTDPPMTTSSPLPNLDSRHASLPSAALTDTRSTSLSHNSRRNSSHGQSHSFSGAGQGTVSHSRRSSGAFSAANALPAASTTRRSSNAVPSQLQLNTASPNPIPKASTGAVSRENTPPGQLVSTDAPLTFDLGGNMAGLNGSKSSYSSNNETFPTTGGGFVSYRGEKGINGDIHTFQPFHLSNPYYSRPLSNRYGAVSSPGHHSTLSSNQDHYSVLSTSHDRYSSITSGAFTYASHILPSSPAETQATSFFTDNSDLGMGDGSISSAPDVVHPDRPGSGHRSIAGTTVESYGEETNEMEVNMGEGSNRTAARGERIIRRKGSRFRFDFWKRRQKGASP